MLTLTRGSCEQGHPIVCSYCTSLCMASALMAARCASVVEDITGLVERKSLFSEPHLVAFRRKSFPDQW